MLLQFPDTTPTSNEDDDHGQNHQKLKYQDLEENANW
jgi:hypothetical protein